MQLTLAPDELGTPGARWIAQMLPASVLDARWERLGEACVVVGCTYWVAPDDPDVHPYAAKLLDVQNGCYAFAAIADGVSLTSSDYVWTVPLTMPPGRPD